jgi:hypothetical protein
MIRSGLPNMDLYRGCCVMLWLLFGLSVLLWIQSYCVPFDGWTIGGGEITSEHGELFIGIRISADVFIPIILPYWVATATAAVLLYGAWLVRRRRNRLRGRK